MIKPLAHNRWLIITPPHVLFLAKLVAGALKENGFQPEIKQELPKSYDRHDIYVVLSANSYNSKKLPPANKRVLIQLEQSSSDWFNEDYLSALKDSYAVLDYNYENINYLQSKGVGKRLWYLPLGADSSLAPPQNHTSKRFDLLFFGDLRSDRRKR